MSYTVRRVIETGCDARGNHALRAAPERFEVAEIRPAYRLIDGEQGYFADLPNRPGSLVYLERE